MTFIDQQSAIICLKCFREIQIWKINLINIVIQQIKKDKFNKYSNSKTQEGTK